MAATKIQVRRDDAPTWSSINPVLNEGEFGLDLTSMKLKIGDGVNNWNQLLYVDDDGPTLSNGSTQPSSPTHGDIWVNTSVCPPILNVYSDPTVCPGDGGWNEIGAGGEFDEVTITPTSIVPEVSEQILTAVANIPKVDNNVPADVFWTWYQYDGATGEAGKTLLKTLTNREDVDTVVLPAAAAGKFIGCTVTYLSVTISETQRCAVGVPPGPVATMKGLRFDGSRATYLKGGKGTNKFTYSCWIKPTGRMRLLFMENGTAGSNETVWEMNSNRLYFGNGGTAKLFPSQELEQKKWQHVVLQNDPEGDCAIYLDGVLLSSEAGLSTLDWDGEMLRIGINTQGAGGDGYMSDVYYIADQCVPPTTFAKQFPEGWGPLDSTEVKATFAAAVQPPVPEQPYDSRANTDQVWSGSVTATASYVSNKGPTNGFDGLRSTACVLDDNDGANEGTITIAFSPALSGSVAIGINAGRKISVNGGDQITSSDTSSASGPLFQVGSYEAINSIEIQSGGSGYPAALSMLEIDGRPLVDQDVWNASQNWSGKVTLTGTMSANGPSTLFDGDITTGANTSVGTDVATFDFSDDPPQGAIRFYVTAGASSGGTPPLKVNGVASGIGWSGSPGWVSPGGNPTQLESFSFGNEGPGNRYLSISAVEVGGKILVDSGAQWNTSQHWSTEGVVTGDCNSVDRAFDGDLGTSATNSNNQNNNPATYTLNPPITGATSIRVYGRSDNSTVPLEVNGVDVNAPVDFGWVDVSASTLSSFTVYHLSGTGASQIGAIEVDGKILVDATPDWNTSEVWSRGISNRYTNDAEFIDPKSNAFDGNVNIGLTSKVNSSSADNSITFTPSQPINVQNNIKVTFAINPSYRGYFFQINEEAPVSIDVYTKYGFILPFTGTLNTLKIYSTNTISSGQTFGTIYAIQVDGEYLVDQGNMGENGFYLPFDTTAKGTPDFPNLWDRNDMIIEEPMFDGVPGKVYQTQKTSPDDEQQYATWTLPEPMGSNFEIAFRVVSTGGYALTGQANGEAVTGGMYGSNPYAVARRDYPLESVTINSFAKEGGNALQNLSVEYIKVDNKILVDYRSIGADDSGAGNNFQDYNFIVGNDPAVGFTSTIDKSKFDPSNGGYRSPSKIFDGRVDTYASTRTRYGPNEYIFDWEGYDLPECKSLRVKIYVAANFQGNDDLRVVINDGSSYVLSKDLGTGDMWVDLTDPDSYQSGDGYANDFPFSTINFLYVDLMLKAIVQNNACTQLNTTDDF